ncbi:toxin Cry1Ac domain D-VI-related protein [Microbacteriaceae bacterium 4G12]
MKKKRIIIASMSVLLIGCGTFGVVKHQQTVKAEEHQKMEAQKAAEKKEMEKEQALEQTATVAVDKLFANPEKTLLSDGYSDEEVTKDKDVVYKVKKNTLQKELQDELTKAIALHNQVQSSLDAVNKLFKDDKKDALADNVNKEKIDEVNKQVNENTPQKSVQDALKKDIQKAYDIMNEQEKQAADNKINENSSTSTNKEIGKLKNIDNGSSNNGNDTTSNDSIVGDSNQPIVAKMNLANQTDQMITVVASDSSANIKLWQKDNGTWKQVLSTSGHVGSQGVGKGSESASRTPRGAYELGFAFGTHNPGTKLPYRQITNRSYWISNVDDPQYNTWQERDSSSSEDEKLSQASVQYEYAIALNYDAGVGGGSAFFLHVDNGQPTAGCISVPRSVMETFMKSISSGAYIVNVNSEKELLNY